MIQFMILTLGFVGGLTLSQRIDAQPSALWMMLALICWLLASLPLWQRHGQALARGSFGEVFEDPDPLPIASLLLITLGLGFFGFFSYARAMYSLPPNHLSKVMDDDPWTRWRVQGVVAEEPTLQADFLDVLVRVKSVQRVPFGKSSGRGRPGAGGVGSAIPAAGSDGGTGAGSGVGSGSGSGSGAGTAPAGSPSGPADAPALEGGGAGGAGHGGSGSSGGSKRKGKSSKKRKPKGKGKTGGAASESIALPPEPVLPVDGGSILVRIPPEDPAFSRVGYNMDIAVTGLFSAPAGRRNPGSLDFKHFMASRGIFRSISIRGRRSGVELGSSVGTGNPFYQFAIKLRTTFLQVTKMTMPYPESAFIAGVLLGLRGGLPPQVAAEFRATGVSHVLAVSGLHVTIIAALFLGIFTLTGLSLRVYAPIIVFFLYTFALIVGWPASAVRAATMNSLFLLSRAYLKDRGFAMSILFALSVAAIYILMINPLVLTDPGFTLSFMAIFALAVFSGPADKMLVEALRGPGLLCAFAAVTVYYLALMIFPRLVVATWFFQVSALYGVGMFLLCKKLSAQSDFESLGFEMLPGWLRSYLASQVGIFLGMMGPLSAFYFGAMSLSSPVANLIAIPLIGVIVQLAMLAAIIGNLVPFVGVYIALVINAGNWLAVKFFLGLAHFLTALLPFPRISQPTFFELCLYYVLLMLFFFWVEVKAIVAALREAVADLWQDDHYRRMLALLGGGLGFAGFFVLAWMLKGWTSRPDLRLTLLDVGHGSAFVAETSRRVMLINGGPVDRITGRDAGMLTTLSVLAGKRIKGIDALVVSSVEPQNLAGVVTVLQNQPVRTVYTPFPVHTGPATYRFSDFFRDFSVGDTIFESDREKQIYPETPPSIFWEESFEVYRRFCEELHRQPGVRLVQVKAGDRIDDFDATVRVLSPRAHKPVHHMFYDALSLEILGPQKQRFLVSNGSVLALEEELRDPVDVAFFLGMPFPGRDLERYIQEGRIRQLVVSWRNPPRWLYDRFTIDGKLYSATLERRERSVKFSLRDLPRQPFHRTDENGAFEVAVRGRHLEPYSYIKAAVR